MLFFSSFRVSVTEHTVPALHFAPKALRGKEQRVICKPQRLLGRSLWEEKKFSLMLNRPQDSCCFRADSDHILKVMAIHGVSFSLLPYPDSCSLGLAYPVHLFRIWPFCGASTALRDGRVPHPIETSFGTTYKRICHPWF